MKQIEDTNKWNNRFFYALEASVLLKYSYYPK